MHTKPGRPVRTLALAATAILASFTLSACGGSSSNTVENGVGVTPFITFLSSQPEYVSGGTVLVDIARPAAAGGLGALHVTVNGSNDATSTFAADPAHPGHMLGVLAGLKTGDNTITADFGHALASANVTNYAAGAILSGPRTTPFNCQTQDFVLPDGSKLGAATDADARRPPWCSTCTWPAAQRRSRRCRRRPPCRPMWR